MNSNFSRIGYITPPSVTKKKAFVQLQNAPSSRKGQSTLDTSPEQKALCFYDNKGELLEDTKFSQSLFNQLLNECQPSTTHICETSSIKELRPDDAITIVMDFMKSFNARSEDISSLFV